MSDVLPWYKQFWPWFLIILPTCVVIASITTLTIAIKNADSLVAEEYYKDGKAINIDLAKTKYAKQIGMNFMLEVKDNILVLTQHGGPEYKTGLNVKLYHPTQAEKDFQIMATADPSGQYQISLNNPIQGNWEVRLESFDNAWRLHKRIKIQNNQEYWFN